MTSRYDLQGQKAIKDFLGVSDWRTVLRKKAFGAPVFQQPDGKWGANSVELDVWRAGGCPTYPSGTK